MKYRIVIPVYNEARHVDGLLARFKPGQLASIIVVDDGSKDKTAEIIRTKWSGVTLLQHKINLGKGKSLETGVLKSMKDGAEITILMDGDLQHRPEDVERFVRVFRRHPEIEIVFGARKIGKTMKLRAFVGNKFLTVLINLLFRYFLNDTQCGFRAIRNRCFKKLKWKSSGYEAETEMIINAAKNRLPYREIPIDTIYLDYHKGTYFIDGIIIMLKIIFWRIKTIFWK